MQSTLSNTFNAEVRANLARSGLRVSDLASHLGISEATAYRWMSQSGEWPLNEAGIAAEYFGFDSLVSMIRAGQRIAS